MFRNIFDLSPKCVLNAFTPLHTKANTLVYSTILSHPSYWNILLMSLILILKSSPCFLFQSDLNHFLPGFQSCVCASCLVMSNSLLPHGLHSPWNFPGQNTGVSSLSLFLGNLPNLGIEPMSPTLQVNSLPAEPQGKLMLQSYWTSFHAFSTHLTLISGLYRCPPYGWKMCPFFPSSPYRNNLADLNL